MSKQQEVVDIDEDDNIQDWSQLAQLSRKNAQNILPKRGEKEFEPDGTNMQELLLYKAKKEMFGALHNSIRGTIVKSQVVAIYIPTMHQALVVNPKGAFLQSMGSIDANGQCWLNIYEYLYLAERGSVTPYWNPDHMNPNSKHNDLIPLGIEDIYSFFKTQDELNNFTVYAHLKRLGFVVQLANENKTTFYPPIIKSFLINNTLSTLFDQISRIFQSTKKNLFNGLFYKHSHYKFCKYTTSPQLYEKLKILVPYAFVPKTIAQLRKQKESFIRSNDNKSLCQIRFNIWKPETNFKKKFTELPDYQVVLYDKNDNNHHFPTLKELKNIFNSLDYKFDFLDDIENDPDFSWDNNSFINGASRKYTLNNSQKKKSANNSASSDNKNSKKEPNKMVSMKRQKKPNSLVSPPVRQLRRLKNGYRSFLLAVIDNGIISFIKLCEADFGFEDVWYVPTSSGTGYNKSNKKCVMNKNNNKIKKITDEKTIK